MLNDRFTETLKDKWWKKRLQCSKIEDQQDGISIANIGGVFIVILVGIGLAIITLIFEYFWFKYHRHATKIIDIAQRGKYASNVVEPVQQGPSIITHQKPNEPGLRARATTQIQIVD